MKEFHDPDDTPSNYWPSARLGDVYEVGRLMQRAGMRHVKVIPDLLAVAFIDPLINSRARLEIEPPRAEEFGWWWYASISTPNTFSMGPLALDRWVLFSPSPRDVVRAYRQETWYERRPAPKKLHN